MEANKIISRLRERNDLDVNSSQDEQLRSDFRQVLEIFIEANYAPDLNGDTLMCSIHDSFPSHHTCVACNLQENAKLIERFLLYAEVLPSVNYSFTTLILLLYLLVERIHVYFELTKIPESYQSKYFQVFKEIKYWANFLKHPKSFMLVLHPSWHYKGMDEETCWRTANKKTIIIDSSFVRHYYSGDQNNSKLYKLLARNDDVIVLFPNPIDLIKRFTQAQKKFVAIIAENEMVREMLESETMEKELFSPIHEGSSAIEQPGISN